MRPITLTMSAFGPYGSVVEVPFHELGERGIYLITGDTGAGKTTIFDAISYALFGETSDPSRSAAQMRSDFAPIDVFTEVELEFDYAGERYAIRRSPAQERPKKRGTGTMHEDPLAWLKLPDGKEIEGVTAVNEAVARILKMNARQFRQIVMIAQGKFRELLTTSSENRRAIFRELFGTEPYERVQRELKNRQMRLARADAEAKTAISSTLQLVELTGEERCVDYAELRQHAAVKGDALLELLAAQEADDEAAREALDAELAERTKALGEVDQALKEAARRAHVASELSSAKRQARRLEEELARATRARDEAEGFASEALELGLRVRTLEASLESLADLEQARGRLSEFEAQGRALGEELEAVRSDLARELGGSALASEGAGRPSTLDGALSVAREEAGALRSRASELEGALAAHAQAEAELGALVEERDRAIGWQRELGELEARQCAAQAAHTRAVSSYGHARDRADAARATFHALERRFLDEQAGILAGELKPGEPCPVCGSLEHPAPAERSAECPSEAEVDAAHEASEREAQKAASASKEAGEAAALAAAAREACEHFIERHGSADALAQSLETLDRAMTAKEGQIGHLAAQCSARERAIAHATRLEELIQRASRAKEDIDQRAQELARARERARARVETLEKGLPAKDLSEANAAIAAAKRRLGEIEDLRAKAKEAFSAASTELGSARARVEAQGQVLAEIPERDVAELEAKRGELSGAQRALALRRDAVKARLATNARATVEFKGWLRRYRKLLDEHAIVDALSNTANGSLSGVARVTFETFVQQAYLDRVVAAANRRLAMIANGRYELMRRPEARNLRQQSGLELSVLDHRTGKERDVATLSGGESFEASLSLALGLSDVVQAHSGGIHLDTLFIDEGFGSLDSEALQNAIRMLTSLTPEDKLVGIISHVDALRESIDTRIVVSSGREGSTLTVEV